MNMDSLANCMRACGSQCSRDAPTFERAIASARSPLTATDMVEALGVIASSPRFNAAVVVDVLTAKGAPVDWITVAHDLLDDDGFTVSDAEGFSQLCAAYRRGSGQQLPLEAVVGRRWRNAPGQLAFLLHATLAPPEVFTFEGAARKLDGVPAGTLNQAWLCRDLLAVLASLADAGHMARVREILEHPAKTCAETLLVGVACVASEYGVMQREVMSALLPPFLSSSSGGLVRRLGSLNQGLVLEALAEICTRDPSHTCVAVDVCHDLQVLSAMLDLAPCSLSLDLALAASRKQLLDLEQWLVSAIRRDPTFLQAAVLFLDKREQALHGAYDATPVPTDVRVLLRVVDQAGVRGMHEDVVRPHVVPGDSNDTTSSPRFGRDIEDAANAYFQNLYSQQVSVDDLVTLLRQLQGSRDSREQQVLGCMVQSLIDEYRFFPRYPDKELRATSLLLGTLIRDHLIPVDKWDAVLRFVSDAIRKPPGGKMFVFGLLVLRRCGAASVLQWPQFGMQLIQVQALNEADPELYASLVQAVARQCGGGDAHAPDVVAPQPMLMAGAAFEEGSGDGVWQHKSQHLASTVSRVPHTCSVGSGQSTGARVDTVDTVGERGESRFIDVDDKDGSVLAAQVANMSLLPGAPSLAALVNTESLESAAEKYKGSFREPVPSVVARVHFIMNNLSMSNVDSKIADIRGALLPDFCAWFANYMVVRRAAQEANYHVLYVSLCDKLGDKALHHLLVRTTLYYVKILLYSERTVKESNDRALLKNLGVWLGLLTFAKNRPVLSRDLELKSIVIEAYQRGRLIAVLPFVQKLLECCRDSSVFKPTNPMIGGILSLLAELHSLKGLKINNAFCIELVFKAFNIAAEDVKPTDVLRTLPRERQCNPDWGMDNLGDTSATPLPATDQHASPALMAEGTASQKHDGAAATSGVQRRYEHDSAAAAVDGSATPGIGPAAGGAALPALSATLPLQSSMGVEHGALSPVHTLIVISPQLSQVSEHLHLRRVVLSAMDRAIMEILTPVVERSVTIACYTTVELLLKDFAMDPDEGRMRSAAHLMVSTLAGSLALVTSKDPLRASLANALKAQLQATPGLAADMLDSIVGLLATDNLDLGCSAIERAATEKAARDVDNLLQPAYDARIKARAQGKVFADTSAFHGRFPHSLPESLRPRPGHLDAHMMRVYEDFNHTTRPTAAAGMSAAAPAGSSTQDPSGSLDTAGGKAPHPGVPLSAGTASYMERFLLWQGRADAAIAAKEAEGPGADQATLQQLLQELSLSIGTMGPAASDTVALCAKRMLKQLCDGGSKLQLTFHVACLEALALGPGGKRMAHELARLVCDDASSPSAVCSEVVEMLVRAQLLDLPEFDATLNTMLLTGQHIQPTKLLLHLASTCIARGQVLTYRDLGKSLDTLGSLAARTPGNEAILHALDAARNAEMHTVPVRPSAEVPAAVRGHADPDGLREQSVRLFEDWLRLVSATGADDASVSAYLMALRTHGLLGLDDKMDRFVRILVELSVNHASSSMDTHAADMALMAIDALVRLCSAIVTHGGTDVFLSRFLGVLVGVLKRDADARGAAFNSRPFLRIISGIISELDGRTLQTDADLSCLQSVGVALHQLQPISVPAFAFAWLELIGHRSFAPRLVCAPEGSLLYRALLLALLNFLGPYLRAADMAESVRALYRGTMRLLLVLLHDFPEFLCEHHQSLCDAIPTTCVQMRNLVLSAFPRHMRLPDPFSSSLKVDVMPEILSAPRISSRPEHRLPQPITAAVEQFLRAREPASLPKELAKLLVLPPRERDASSTGCVHDVPAINALMLFIGSAAAGVAPEGSPALHLMFGIVSELEAEGRYHMFNAIANQLRFPNSHTHFYSCVILQLFSGVTYEATKEQITRVLLERLIVNRPHPWGLLVTFIELIKNPRYEFWRHDFTQCAPDVERLLKSVANSCMEPVPKEEEAVFTSSFGTMRG